MTQDEAKRLQDICNEAIERIEVNKPPHRPNWTVNWADLSCRDVLVSALNPDAAPTLKIEEASPDAWGFAQAVADEMKRQTGLKFNVETEW